MHKGAPWGFCIISGTLWDGDIRLTSDALYEYLGHPISQGWRRKERCSFEEHLDVSNESMLRDAIKPFLGPQAELVSLRAFAIRLLLIHSRSFALIIRNAQCWVNATTLMLSHLVSSSVVVSFNNAQHRHSMHHLSQIDLDCSRLYICDLSQIPCCNVFPQILFRHAAPLHHTPGTNLGTQHDVCQRRTTYRSHYHYGADIAGSHSGWVVTVEKRQPQARTPPG